MRNKAVIVYQILIPVVFVGISALGYGCGQDPGLSTPVVNTPAVVTPGCDPTTGICPAPVPPQSNFGFYGCPAGSPTNARCYPLDLGTYYDRGILKAPLLGPSVVSLNRYYTTSIFLNVGDRLTFNGNGYWGYYHFGSDIFSISTFNCGEFDFNGGGALYGNVNNQFFQLGTSANVNITDTGFLRVGFNGDPAKNLCLDGFSYMGQFIVIPGPNSPPTN